MSTDEAELELAAIRQAAQDYYGGWYEADAELIGRSLHADLAKRAVRKHEDGGEYLHHLGRERMLALTQEGGGSEVPPDRRRCDVTVLDRYEEMAVVKVVATQYVDYLELAKIDGRWLIVNALWTENRGEG